jgi:hypothetical protein
MYGDVRTSTLPHYGGKKKKAKKKAKTKKKRKR